MFTEPFHIKNNLFSTDRLFEYVEIRIAKQLFTIDFIDAYTFTYVNVLLWTQQTNTHTMLTHTIIRIRTYTMEMSMSVDALQSVKIYVYSLVTTLFWKTPFTVIRCKLLLITIGFLRKKLTLVD